MTLEIRIGLDWQIGGATLDLAAIAQLLDGIAATGTVRATAQRLGLSYRTVWGKLEAAETALGQQIIVKSKGHGSKLSVIGEQLKSLVDDLTRRLQYATKQEQATFENGFRAIFLPEPRRISMACSHDLVIEDCVEAGLLPGWEIRNMGSQKAIDALLAGKADMAGFHLPEMLAGQPEMQALWSDPHYFVAPIMCRELGLVVARGNPLKISGIDDLVRPEVRFINRQKTAGTRLRLDEILRVKGIDSKAIRGYRHEEFTHSAVANAVAAGAADVAFALRAAVTELNVAFIPVGLETYCVCGKFELAEDPRYKDMLQILIARMKKHPGYAKPRAASKSKKLTGGSRIAAIAGWQDKS